MASFTALATVSISYGLGVHAVDLDLDQTVGAVKFLVFGQFVISLSMGTSKVAVGLFLLRIIQEMWYASIPGLLWSLAWIRRILQAIIRRVISTIRELCLMRNALI